MTMANLRLLTSRLVRTNTKEISSLNIFLKIFLYLHMKIYVITNARLGKQIFGIPCLLLLNIGAQSNIERKAVLAYLEEKDAYYIVASNGGSNSHPSWYYNLKKNPLAKVKIGKEVQSVEAEELTGDERTKYWVKLDNLNRGGYQNYQIRTHRQIPIFKLKITK